MVANVFEISRSPSVTLKLSARFNDALPTRPKDRPFGLWGLGHGQPCTWSKKA